MNRFETSKYNTKMIEKPRKILLLGENFYDF